jgi:hypothetical protein
MLGPGEGGVQGFLDALQLGSELPVADLETLEST